jgi:hypothetical protein
MSTGLSISKASYGSGIQTVDVATAVTSHIQDGKLNLVVSPGALNVEDPAPGVIKTLTITYSINNGSSMTTSATDGNAIDINAPPAQEATGLVIEKAEYGYAGNMTDVTNAIQSHVSNGSINITVGPQSAGIPDPNPAKQKSLTVTYTINGAHNTDTIVDGKNFKVYAPAALAPDNRKPAQHVMSAVGVVFTNIARFIGIYLQTLSVGSAVEFGNTFISPILWGGLAFIIPFFSFWLLPVIVFWIRIFVDYDVV